MAEGFTKLFRGITRSTLWSLDNDHKAVWFFLMAEADENGNVVCTVPGIAKANDVTVEKAEAIIKRFMSPDPYSGSKELEGRRIEEIDRGWRLVNHAKFRRMRSREEKLEYDRLYRENERLAARLAKLEDEKAKKTEDVVDSRKQSPEVVNVVQAEAEAEAEAKGGGGGGTGAPPAAGEKKQSPVKAVIAKIEPLWSAKYGRPFVASREDRRSLGVTLQGFLELGAKGEAEIAKLPIWFGRFLADDREVYVKQAHSLRQFLNDVNFHSLSSAERLHANGQRTPEEWRAQDEVERRRVARANELPSLPKGEPRPEMPARPHGARAGASSGAADVTHGHYRQEIIERKSERNVKL